MFARLMAFQASVYNPSDVLNLKRTILLPLAPHNRGKSSCVLRPFSDSHCNRRNAGRKLVEFVRRLLLQATPTIELDIFVSCAIFFLCMCKDKTKDGNSAMIQ